MRSGASFWSLMTFSYAKPLIDCAYAHDEKLTIEQMGNLPETISFEKTVPILEAAWQKEREKDPKSDRALLRALAHVFKWRMLGKFSLQLGFKALSMVSPLLVFQFTEFVEKREEDLVEEDYRVAVMVACGVIGLEMV